MVDELASIEDHGLWIVRRWGWNGSDFESLALGRRRFQKIEYQDSELLWVLLIMTRQLLGCHTLDQHLLLLHALGKFQKQLRSDGRTLGGLFDLLLQPPVFSPKLLNFSVQGISFRGRFFKQLDALCRDIKKREHRRGV